MDKKNQWFWKQKELEILTISFMAKDFERQHFLTPSLCKLGFHGTLSFYQADKIEDEKMIEIGREYLEKMKISNTQFSITKHIDKDPPYMHIIANVAKQ